MSLQGRAINFLVRKESFKDEFGDMECRFERVILRICVSSVLFVGTDGTGSNNAHTPTLCESENGSRGIEPGEGLGQRCQSSHQIGFRFRAATQPIRLQEVQTAFDETIHCRTGPYQAEKRN